MIAALLVVIVGGCRSSSSLTDEEAVRRAQACIAPSTSIAYLPAPRPDFEACLEKAMREPAGRRFLLDAGNAAVAGWSSDMARFVGDDLGLHPALTLGQVLGGLGAVPAAGGTGREVGDFYRTLVRAVFANVKDRREAAAEVAGIMQSFVSQGAGKDAEPFIRTAREKLPASGNPDEVTREFVSMATTIMEEIAALSLWADDRVRAKLLAGDPTSPAASPPATDPPLESPSGRLHIPHVDVQPAHDMFFQWYEHEGGLPLANAAKTAVLKSGIPRSFLQV